MSRRHGARGRTTPRRPRIDRQTVEDAATVASILRGCTCGAGRTVTLHHDPGGLDHATVIHDHDCPAAHTRDVVLFDTPPRRTRSP